MWKVILAAGLLCSCKGLVVSSPLGAMGTNMCQGGQCYTQDKCESLRSSYRTWGAVAVGTSAVAGGGGLTAALPDSSGVRLGLGIGSVISGIIGAVAVYLRDDTTKEYTSYCTKAPSLTAPGQ